MRRWILSLSRGRLELSDIAFSLSIEKPLILVFPFLVRAGLPLRFAFGTRDAIIYSSCIYLLEVKIVYQTLFSVNYYFLEIY